MFSDSRLLVSDTNELDALFDTKGITKYRQDIKDFLIDTKYGTKDLSTFKQYLKDNNIAFSGFSKVVNAGKTAIKSFGASLGSMAVSWAIGKALSLIATGIINYINEFDNLKEKSESFSSSVSEFSSKIAEGTSQIEELSEKYYKLSEDVSNSIFLP